MSRRSMHCVGALMFTAACYGGTFSKDTDGITGPAENEIFRAFKQVTFSCTWTHGGSDLEQEEAVDPGEEPAAPQITYTWDLNDDSPNVGPNANTWTMSFGQRPERRTVTLNVSYELDGHSIPTRTRGGSMWPPRTSRSRSGPQTSRTRAGRRLGLRSMCSGRAPMVAGTSQTTPIAGSTPCSTRMYESMLPIRAAIHSGPRSPSMTHPGAIPSFTPGTGSRRGGAPTPTGTRGGCGPTSERASSRLHRGSSTSGEWKTQTVPFSLLGRLCPMPPSMRSITHRPRQ